MALFELFIPALDENGFNVTARIEADNWMHALRNGLAKLGEGVDARNVLCDIHETGIDVTEPNSGRVFRIRELDETAAAPAPAPAPAAAPAAPVPAPAAAPIATAPPVRTAPASAPTAPVAAPAAMPPAATPVAPPAAARPAAASPAPVALPMEQIVRTPAREQPRVAIGRIRAKAQGKPVEDIIADLFEETSELHSQSDLS
ncbi:MAG: hypothetical protein AAFY60_19995, partial [Myxococcota bacterium]